jgi:YebC/PmpR family DNA-binding regulatory protein
MPGDNIQRAIKKGAGELGGVTFEDFTIEGYGQAGVAILLEGTTDNRNRTVSELRNLFSKHGGSMGEQGCVAWMFHRKGVLRIPTAGKDEETVMEAAIELGAEDLLNDGDTFRVLTDPGQLEEVRRGLEERSIAVESSTIENIPETTIQVEGEDAGRLLKLVEVLEDHDDVNNLSANFEMDDALIEQLSG